MQFILAKSSSHEKTQEVHTKNTKGVTDAQDSIATADSEYEEEEEEPATTCEGDKMPVFDNMFDIFKSPFTEDVENL